MPHLFYFIVPPDTPPEGEIILQGEEAHHAIRVVRLRPGEPIAFINGKGGKWLGKVMQVSKETLIAKITHYQCIPKDENPITLFLGWLHRDSAIEMVINYGTELGISEFRFFQAERSIRPARLLPRIQKWAIQSCKTVGRAWFPEIKTYNNLETALESFHGRLFISTISRDVTSIDQIEEVSHCGIIIGPEGDLSENEISLAIQKGGIPVHLGPYIYRSELSVLVGTILIMHKQRRFNMPPQFDFSI